MLKSFLSFMCLTFVGLSSPLAKAEGDEYSRWQEAVSEGFAIKAEVDEFITILGGQPVPDDGSEGEGSWRDDGNGINEGDDILLSLLQIIARKQNMALRATQKAVELYHVNYFEAALQKQKACLVSGHARIKAEAGLAIAKSDFSLSQQAVFITRFESINQRLYRFRDLLGCWINP